MAYGYPISCRYYNINNQDIYSNNYIHKTHSQQLTKSFEQAKYLNGRQAGLTNIIKTKTEKYNNQDTRVDTCHSISNLLFEFGIFRDVSYRFS